MPGTEKTGGEKKSGQDTERKGMPGSGGGKEGGMGGQKSGQKPGQSGSGGGNR